MKKFLNSSPTKYLRVTNPLIHFWLKKYGSTKVIEHYFLKKLEVVLQSNNWEALRVTVAEMSEWLELKIQHKPAFTLPENQQALFE